MTSNSIYYRLSCWLLGALFIFSGAAKGLNPFGLSLQFLDYFSVLHLQFLDPFAGLMGIGLPVVEMLLGVMLLYGYYRRITAWAALLFMGFFTMLTLWIALKNPVSDCGCFGDVLVISNWATFYKNVGFMVPAVVVFCGRNFLPQRWKIRPVVLIAVILAIFPTKFYFTLPAIDSTPFKVGVDVWAAMHDGVPAQSETILLYRNLKNGTTHQFYLTDTVWRNAGEWEYVDTEVVTTDPGRQNSITQLPMIDQWGADRAGEVLQTPGRVLIIASPDPAGASGKIERLLEDSAQYQRMVLLHPTLRSIEIPGVEVYNTDSKTLHTLVQNRNGGYLTLKDGKITKKAPL